MPITAQDRAELKRVCNENKDKFGGREEDYFALLYLTRKFMCRPEDVANQIAFGGNDYGLDAFYLDRPSSNLYLYQFKWSEDHNLLKGSMDRLLNDGMPLLFGAAGHDEHKNELLNHLKAELTEKPKIERVFVHFVFMGDKEKASNSKGLDFRKEALEKQVSLVQEFFGNPEVSLQVEFLSHMRVPTKPQTPDEGTIRLSQHVSTTSAEGIRMFVGFVPLMDLYGIYQALEHRFLDRNIRFGLSSANAPNRKIREALTDIVIKGVLGPDVFPFNHNGVALAAHKVVIESGYAKLSVPRLLNGAQTMSSLKLFLEEKGRAPALKSNRARLDAIQVLAKIVEHDPNSSFITQVTICNNRQNPVEPWTLRANDLIQCDLADKLRDKGHVLYERQENAMASYSEEELEAIGLDTSRAIRIRPLAQTFLAIQGEITRMSKLPDVFEVQRQYDDTFRESYCNGNVRKMVLAYKVHLCLRAPLGRMEEKMPQKWMPAFKKARNLIWALLLQGVFNDPDLASLLEQHGNDLRKSWEFNNYLRTLASSRVQGILRRLLSHRDYAPRVAADKPEFLRTKETFHRSMEFANRMYGWTKRSL